MKITKLYMLMAILSIVLSPADVTAEEIAIIDIQKIITESLAAKSIATQIEKKRDEFQAEVEKEEEKLHSDDQSLSEQRSVLSKEVFEQKAKEFRSKVVEAQRMVQSRRAQLDKAHVKALEKVRKHTLDIVDGLSGKKNFKVVLPKAQVFYSKNELDISDEILKKLNEKLPKVEVVIEE